MVLTQWPHDVSMWPEPGDAQHTLVESRNILGEVARLRRRSAIARQPLRGQLERHAAELSFSLHNGTMPEALRGKANFTKTVRELGLCAPATAVVRCGQDLDGMRDELLALGQDGRRLCKPLGGTRGSGLRVVSSIAEAREFLRTQPFDYLVQQCVPPTGGDFRYVSHRTVTDLETGAPPSLRVVVERLGPTVTGDGHSTLSQLIDGLWWRTRTDRKKLRLGVGHDRVIPAGERVQLVGSGNIAHPKHARFPNPETLEQLDEVMTDFLAALEARLGRILATICVDIGLNAGRVVFYEMQVQFASPYWYRLPGLSRADRAAVRKAMRDSMYYSGRVMRDRYGGGLRAA